jgi:hypothetical protein
MATNVKTVNFVKKIRGKLSNHGSHGHKGNHGDDGNNGNIGKKKGNQSSHKRKQVFTSFFFIFV